MRRVLIIDGKKLNSINELHEYIAKELEFPNYYGKNLNALWDCLTDYRK